MANRHRSAPTGTHPDATMLLDSLPGSMSTIKRIKPVGGKGRLWPASASNPLDSTRSSVSSLASSAPSLSGPRVSLANLNESLGIKRKNRRKRPFLDEAPRRTHWESMVLQRRQSLRSTSPPAVTIPELNSLSATSAGHSASSKFPMRAGEVTWDPRALALGVGKATTLGSSSELAALMPRDGNLNQAPDTTLKEARLFLEPVIRPDAMKSPTRSLRRLGPQDNDSWISSTLLNLGTPGALRRDKQKRRPTFTVPDKPVPKKKPSVQKKKLHRSATSYGVAGGRGLDEVLAREAARPALMEGFSPKELQRMQRAFKRFTASDCSEIDRDVLFDIIIYLGYFGATEDVVEDIAAKVSEFSTFTFEELVEVVENFVSYEREQFRVVFEEHAEAAGLLDSPLHVPTKFDWRTPSSLSLTQNIRISEDECSNCGHMLLPEAKYCRHCGEERPERPHILEIPMTPMGKPRGILPASKLHDVLRALGQIPLKGAIVEVLAASGIPADASLDFDGFIRFMAVYRVTEGFQREQINLAQKIFRIHRVPGSSEHLEEMDPSQLSVALIEMFGTHASAYVKNLVYKLSISSSHDQDVDSNNHSTTSSPRGHATGEALRANNVNFHEFLIWARRVHDGLVEYFQGLFFEAAVGGSTVARGKIPQVLHEMGFTLSPAAFQELFTTAGLDLNDGVDFDEFVRLAKVVQKTSGFTNSEVLELSDVFDKYDYNGNGEIDKLELLDLLRYLGFKTSLEDVHRFLKKVDHNENGSMDLHEFLRFLRTHKENLIQEISHVFDAFNDKATGTLALKDVRLALASAGYEARGETLKEALYACGDPKALTLQDFIEVADRCRKDTAAEKRKRAGFEDAEFEKLRRLFGKRCKEGIDVLDKGEFLWLLIDLGMPIKTKEDREEVFVKLREARENALMAGLSETDVGNLDSHRVSFWALLHFLRHYERQNDQRAMTKEEAAIDKARFTHDEVREFRDIYDAWLAYNNQEGEQVTLPTDMPPGTPETSAPSQGTSRQRRHSLHDIFEPMKVNVRQSVAEHVRSSSPRPSQVASPGVEKHGRQRRKSVQLLLGTEPVEGLLSVDALLVLLCSIQIQLNVRDQRILKDKAMDISGRDNGKIDFADFLELMRWMTDSNLGDINFKVGTISNKMNKSLQRITTRDRLGTGSDQPLPQSQKSRPGRRGSV